MKRYGCAIGFVAAVIAAILIFVFAGGGPQGVANEFMLALARGDVKQLTTLGYIEGESDEEAAKSWQTCLERASGYRFGWRMKKSLISGDTTATVDMEVIRNALRPNSYGENFSLPMVKVDGRWRVDVLRINRSMFPALPR